jgi:hypothetical protein
MQRTKFDNLPAATAGTDQEMMMTADGWLKTRKPVLKTGFQAQAEKLHFLKIPIDGGQGQTRIAESGPAGDFLSRKAVIPRPP